MGAGLITHKCDVCLGTGHLVEAEPIKNEEIAETITEELPKPKRKYTRKEPHVLRET